MADAMVLIVDKETRKVVDCDVLDYSYKFAEILGRHDLNKVDLVVRERTATTIQPTEVVEPEVDTSVERPAPVDVDEDVPF